jgi:WD40 repeat protein
MRSTTLLIASLFVVSLLSPNAKAQQPPSFAKQVRPLLARFCLECHNATKLEGGLNLETYKTLRDGGGGGDVILPGQADESRLVLMVEGKRKPTMPPKKTTQPKPDEVGVLRAWVDAGAKDDSSNFVVTLPDVKPRIAVKPPVTALAYRPDGKLLAAATHRDVVFLDPATGNATGYLPAAPTRVTALLFSPSGEYFAVATGTVGTPGEVVVYKTAANALPDGTPLHRLAAHKDAVYALAFSPDNKLLATCGYDRLIKLWDVSNGKLVHALKDHSDAVYSVAFNSDGTLLASGAADRAVKVWDVATGKRLFTLSESTDWVYAVAWNPANKQLAAAGVDRSVRVWDVSASGGKIVHSVFAHEGPVARLAYSSDGKTLYSLSEDRGLKAWDVAKMVERTVYPKQPETPLAFAVRPDHKQLAIGRYDGVLSLLEETTGKAQNELLPLKPKYPAGTSPSVGDKIVLPAAIEGLIGRAGQTDFYRFDAKAGQEIGVQLLTATIGSKLEPMLQLIDSSGHVLIESTNGQLGYRVTWDGVYAVGVRDRDYRGDATMTYRLSLGDLPVVTSVFPLGVQRGTETEIRVQGVNLGETKGVRVTAPAEAVIGARLPIKVETSKGPALGATSVVVGEFAEVVGAEKGNAIPLPGTANGRLAEPGQTATWKFTAKKGERLVVEMNARRLGTPLDSTIEILDAKGKPVPWVTLRCLARTYTTFRDHDSASSGIRIENWSELSINDYLLVGNELMRINALPKNPDDDCQFFSVKSQRLGFFGTTPTHHPQGQPMYKVSLHPPGTTFPPNGLPVVTLHYRNDDGGPGYGKDSRLFFDPPADGEYAVRIGDARGQGGPQYAYRLTIRPPIPSFTVSFSPTAPAVGKGSALPITVTAERSDGFDGAIELQLDNLPSGFSAPATTIPAGENATSFALFAAPHAAVPAKSPPLKLIAKAKMDGKELVREVTGGVPKVIEPGDIVTTTKQMEVTVKPGGEVRVTVMVERRNGFTGRIPLEVRGLPHGVRVLDIGLNGILITEKETTRTVVIYAEPWVEPTTHPFVVLAKREGKNTEHAAKSVLLYVKK